MSIDLANAGLILEVDGAVATITLKRPEVKNAQTPTMWRALAQIGRELSDDIRVVVVRGYGGVFSSGLDRTMLDPTNNSDEESVIGLLQLSDEQMSAVIDEFQQGFTWLRDPRFISIAVVESYAIGAGFQLALSCDLRIATPDAVFSMKEAALGLVPDLTGTQPLVEAVGYSRALEICATACNVPAAVAHEIGLVQAVVESTDVDAHLERTIAAFTSPMVGAVRGVKELLLHATSRDLDTQRRAEREHQVARFREVAALAGM